MAHGAGGQAHRLVRKGKAEGGLYVPAIPSALLGYQAATYGPDHPPPPDKGPPDARPRPAVLRTRPRHGAAPGAGRRGRRGGGRAAAARAAEDAAAAVAAVALLPARSVGTGHTCLGRAQAPHATHPCMTAPAPSLAAHASAQKLVPRAELQAGREACSLRPRLTCGRSGGDGGRGSARGCRRDQPCAAVATHDRAAQARLTPESKQGPASCNGGSLDAVSCFPTCPAAHLCCCAAPPDRKDRTLCRLKGALRVLPAPPLGGLLPEASANVPGLPDTPKEAR
jgi:hypothetical protein